MAPTLHADRHLAVPWRHLSTVARIRDLIARGPSASFSGVRRPFLVFGGVARTRAGRHLGGLKRRSFSANVASPAAECRLLPGGK